MKKIIVFLGLGCWLYILPAAAQLNIPVLDNIQARLDAAFMQAFQQDENAMVSILEALDKEHQRQPHRHLAYWEAFGQYYLSIYYLKLEKPDLARDALNQGVARLESISEPNSEDYTLLAVLTSFNISLEPGRAVVLSQKSAGYVKKALALDDRNMRAYLSRGKSDFYKPVQYGGGKLAEESLLKALALPPQYGSDPYAPGWGRQEAYSYLVQYYLREGRKEDAALYCQRGLKEFPGDYMLLQHQKELN